MLENLAYIDDNQNNLDCIGLILDREFDVKTYIDPFIFLDEYTQQPFNSILVDIHMPKMDGFDLYEKIICHPRYNGCPIFFISSDDTDEVRIKSFSLGAVDFLNRHMTAAEMLTRVKSKISFFQKNRSVLEFGNLKVDLTLLKAFVAEKELKLTFIEFKLLSAILKRYPETSFKEDIIDKVWSHSDLVLDATYYTHVSNLNGKLEHWDYEIITSRNRGTVILKKESEVQ